MAKAESEYWRGIDKKEKTKCLRFLFELTRNEAEPQINGSSLTFNVRRLKEGEDLNMTSSSAPRYQVKIILNGDNIESFAVDKNQIRFGVTTRTSSTLGILIPGTLYGTLSSEQLEYQSVLEILVSKIKRAKIEEATKHSPT